MSKKPEAFLEIAYTRGGIGHTKRSFENLIERSLDFLSELVDVDERIRVVKLAHEMVLSKKFTLEEIESETGLCRGLIQDMMKSNK